MTRVTLHGSLCQAVGKKIWMLDVKSPAEALRAIEANTGKLYKHLATDQDGLVPYKIITDGRDCPVEEVGAPIKKFKTIDIVPIFAGEGNSGTILAIIGIVLVLIAVTILTYGIATAPVGVSVSSYLGIWASVATLALTTGLSLVISGISQMLTKNPVTDKKTVSAPSYVFSGVVNTMQQGNPVPIGYGEAIVGSSVISAGFSSVEIPIKNL